MTLRRLPYLSVIGAIFLLAFYGARWLGWI